MSRAHRSLIPAIAGTAVLGGALLAAAAAPAHAASDPAPINFWAAGTLKPGETIRLDAECGRNMYGQLVTGAMVVGFNGVTSELTVWGAEGQLGGTITVPTNYTQLTADLKLICDNNATRTVTLRAAGAAATTAKPTANAPARVMPKGGAQTGGGAATTERGTSTPMLLAGVGAVGLAGAGAFALRRRAESR